MDGLKIENVVASSYMGVPMDLTEASRILDGSEYNPEKFPGLIYRISSPKTAILLFSSGKLVCTGGKSHDDAVTSINMLKKILNGNGIDTDEGLEIQVQNIVASYGLGQDLNLNSVAISLGLERVEYEPEQFPGLVYRPDNCNVVLLLFGSGNMVCTGARDIESLENAVDMVKNDLRKAGLLY